MEITSKFFSPQNQTSYSNQIQLIFTIEVIGMLGQFGNVGYSLDGGIINSIRNMTKSVDDKTGYPDWYYYKTTASADVILPTRKEINTKLQYVSQPDLHQKNLSQRLGIHLSKRLTKI